MDKRVVTAVVLSSLAVPLVIVAYLFARYGSAYRPTGILVAITGASAISLLPIAFLLGSWVVRYPDRKTRSLRALWILLVPLALLALMGYTVEYDITLASDPSSTSVLVIPFMVVYGWAASKLAFAGLAWLDARLAAR